MVDESIFLSKGFARTLLIGHVTVLAIFAFVDWCRADGGPLKLILTALRDPMRPASKQAQTPSGLSNEIGVDFGNLI
jgi:alpha-1,3-mannosyltransferase